jgi:WD40 repeat protein
LERAHLPLGHRPVPWFAPGSGDLFTTNSGGLFRWPRHVLGEGRLRFGPPEQWAKTGHPYCNFSGSRDGRLMAVSAPLRPNAFVYDGGPGRPPRTFAHQDARQVHLSADGRLLTTAGHDNATGVKVWDVSSGELLHHVNGRLPCARLSSDGRLLLTARRDAESGSRGCQLWEVGSYRALWPQEAEGVQPAALSPDDRLAVACDPAGRLCLLSVESGRTLARLEDPSQGRTNFLSFSPDGGKIVAASNDNQAIQVWDLRLIRKQLAEMGLDWDGPPLPEAKEPSPVQGVEVVRE